MIARVREVIAASTRLGFMLYVSGSMSTKTGRAPACNTAFAVAMNEKEGTITSSPGPTPLHNRARWSAVVQLLVATACATPRRAVRARSKASTRGPCAIHPVRMAFAAACASSSPRNGLVIGIIGSEVLACADVAAAAAFIGTLLRARAARHATRRRALAARRGG